MAEIVELFCSKGGERGSRSQILEGMGEILGSLSCCIGRGSLGHGAAVGKEFDGFSDGLSSCFCDIDAVATIVFRGSADMPSIDTVWVPGALIGWSLMDKNFDAGRRKWSDKISILRYLKDDEDTMQRCILSSMNKIENTGKHE